MGREKESRKKKLPGMNFCNHRLHARSKTVRAVLSQEKKRTAPKANDKSLPFVR